MIQEHTYANIYKQIYVSELNASKELLLFIFCISQGSVVRHLRCGGKYDTCLVAYLQLSPTVEEFLKSAKISESYERISSGMFFMADGVILICQRDAG